VGTVLAVGLAAGCSAGPSQRPPVAVVDDRLPPAAAGPTSTTATPPPAPEVPATDLPWTDCTDRARAELGLGAGPAGLVLECATLRAPLDPTTTGELELGLLRARLASTPAGAAPVVLATGTDAPSTATLARLVTGDGSALLAAHPVVALDRRGTGRSTALDCLTAAQRAALDDVDPDRPGAGTDAAVTAGRDATQACTDLLTPAELSLATDRAADDLDALRERWGVQRLALVGAGDGATLALRYAAAHPGSVSRLVLDAPADPGADAVTRADTAADGAERALDAAAARCAATACGLGADPRGAVVALLARTRTGPGVPGPAGQVLTSGALLAALRAGLAVPGTAAQDRLLAALTAAAAGDGGPALALLDPTATDGRFAARCSDAAVRPTQDQVGQLVDRLRGTRPVFGASGAALLAQCLAWPTPSTQPGVTGLAPLPPVLVLAPAADPAVGPDEATRTAAVLTQAGARTAVLAWQGTGAPALVGSGCVRTAVATYLDTAATPARDTVCPP
jgi:pimeloyl-ACP methyl ester carboxylesterase